MAAVRKQKKKNQKSKSLHAQKGQNLMWVLYVQANAVLTEDCVGED